MANKVDAIKLSIVNFRGSEPLRYDDTNHFQLEQEPMSRTMQLHCISATAFS